MNTKRSCSSRRDLSRLVLAVALSGFTVPAVNAQTFSSGSTGADGPFAPTCSPTPCTVTVPLPASGVFNFTTVNIPAGVTVTFARNAGNTPATLLATGDVTIDGALDLSGGAANGPLPGRAGPGGFDGGLGGRAGTFLLSLNGSPGLGPGGGAGGDAAATGDPFGSPFSGSGGGFGTVGTGPFNNQGGGPTYATHVLFPLIGGSGGGGGAGDASLDGPGGGGGAGAVLVASSGAIILNGSILVNGGEGTASATIPTSFSGCGSGGGVRLVANDISGGDFAALIQVRGLLLGNCFFGGSGRVRLEAFQFNALSIPQQFSRGIPGTIVPAAGFPTLRITAVAGVAAPANPNATFLAAPDIALSPTLTNPVTVDLAATHVPVSTAVEVAVVTEGVATRTIVNSTPLGGTLASSTATASVTLPNGISVISATATFATALAGLDAPIMIEGEEVKWVRVAAPYGGGSTVTYITASGREFAMR